MLIVALIDFFSHLDYNNMLIADLAPSAQPTIKTCWFLSLSTIGLEIDAVVMTVIVSSVSVAA